MYLITTQNLYMITTQNCWFILTTSVTEIGNLELFKVPHLESSYSNTTHGEK